MINRNIKIYLALKLLKVHFRKKYFEITAKSMNE